MSAERERERRGLLDGGDRVATIARWLRQRVPSSEDVTELLLTAWTAEEDPEVLARWARADVTCDLAPEISALIAEYADDQGTHCKAQIAWVDADRTPYASKRFRGICAKGAQEHVRPLDGTISAAFQQTQRHLEAIMEGTARERLASDARMERMMTLFDRQLERAHERIAQLEGQNVELGEAAEDATAAAEDAADVAEEALNEAENAKKDDRLGTVLELVSKQLMTGGG
jgi:hypothetical protein